MLNLHDAVDKVHNSMPEWEIACIIEYNDLYAFNIHPKGEEMFANGCSYVVYKSNGDSGWLPATQLWNMNEIEVITKF